MEQFKLNRDNTDFGHVNGFFTRISENQGQKNKSA